MPGWGGQQGGRDDGGGSASARHGAPAETAGLWSGNAAPSLPPPPAFLPFSLSPSPPLSLSLSSCYPLPLHSLSLLHLHDLTVMLISPPIQIYLNRCRRNDQISKFQASLAGMVYGFIPPVTPHAERTGPASAGAGSRHPHPTTDQLGETPSCHLVSPGSQGNPSFLPSSLPPAACFLCA